MTLVSMFAPLAKVWERANMKNPKWVGNTYEAEAFCKSLLMGERIVKLNVIAMSAQSKVLGDRKISEGSLSEVSAYPRGELETTLNYKTIAFCLLRIILAEFALRLPRILPVPCNCREC